MAEALTLIRIDFDIMENRVGSAISETIVCTFTDEPGRTAPLKMRVYLEGMDPPRLYYAWNREVYPQFVIRKTLVE